jgi:hypothetical protein
LCAARGDSDSPERTLADARTGGTLRESDDTATGAVCRWRLTYGLNHTRMVAMNKRLLASFAVFSCILVAAAGCGVGSAITAGRMGLNLAKKDSYLKIWVDGHEATQNKLKKAYFGYASFKVKETVGTRPTFKYEFIDASRFGRITNVSMQIHQEYEGDFSHQAEFVIYPADSNDSESLLKPGNTTNLGSMPSNYKVMNFEKQTVSGIELKPGLDYMLVFSVAGDRSETVQILISTR